MAIRKIDEELRGTEDRAEKWLELTEMAFDFATNAQVYFRTGDLRKKRDILMTLGTNLVLKDQKLLLEPNEWLVKLGEGYPAVEAEYLEARTENNDPINAKTAALATVNDKWRSICDAIATKIRLTQPAIYWTNNP